MSLASRLLLGALVVGAAGCSTSPMEPRVFGTEGLKATVEAPTLTLTNESGQTVRYIALEGGLAISAMWCLCPGARTIKPGGSTTLAYSTIAGYDPDKPNTVLIYWAVQTSPDQTIPQDEIKVVGAKL